MIIGIGTDIQEISKFEKKSTNPLFLKKLFTENEILLLKNKRMESYVGFFCVKEAIAKAFGTGFRTFMPNQIEVYYDPKGKPCVKLLDNALNLSKQLNITDINISISHSGDFAVAFVVCENCN